jgi:hypothetical protein
MYLSMVLLKLSGFRKAPKLRFYQHDFACNGLDDSAGDLHETVANDVGRSFSGGSGNCPQRSQGYASHPFEAITKGVICFRNETLNVRIEMQCTDCNAVLFVPTSY